MKVSEYLRLREMIERTYHERLKALETVWEIAQEPDEAPGAEESHVVEANGVDKPQEARKHRVSDAVRAILDHMPETFTWKEVQEAIETRNPIEVPNRTAIAQVLDRLVKQRVISLKEIGRGRRPSEFYRA